MALVWMLTRHWNHFVVLDKDLVSLSARIRCTSKMVSLLFIRIKHYKVYTVVQMSGVGCLPAKAGHHQPRPRRHCIRKFGFSCAFSWDWSLFPLFSFLFLFFLSPQTTLYHLHRCTRLITFWVILNFCSNTRLSSAVKLGNSKPLLVLAPWSRGRRAS